jgi:type 1 glutamine amidotransferase
MLETLGGERGWAVTSSDDPTLMTDESLAAFDVVVFLSTSGDVLNPEQEDAFERYIQSGGGFAGIHSATDTEYDWPWYGGLIGTYFDSHPDEQTATLNPETFDHPSMSLLPNSWMRFDEWYNFRTNPRDNANINILMTIDEASYSPGPGAMGADHPMAWAHEYDGGRSFYTALGHTSESYQSDVLFQQHVLGGVEWAAGFERDAEAPTAPTGLTARFTPAGVVLTWDDNAEDDLRDYIVRRSMMPGGPFDVIACMSASTFTDTSLTPIPLYYTVAARDTSSNESSPSAEVFVVITSLETTWKIY